MPKLIYNSFKEKVTASFGLKYKRIKKKENFIGEIVSSLSIIL